MAGIELRSSAFSDHDMMPRRYARDGQNVSPPLNWSDIPDDAAELALVCADPDAPSGDFLHWLVTGIDPGVDGVDEGEVPQGGREHPNGFGEVGWGGPLPPAGDPAHRYFFRVFALREPVEMPDPDDSDAVRAAVENLATESGVLVGLYQR